MTLRELVGIHWKAEPAKPAPQPEPLNAARLPVEVRIESKYRPDEIGHMYARCYGISVKDYSATVIVVATGERIAYGSGVTQAEAETEARRKARAVLDERARSANSKRSSTVML